MRKRRLKGWMIGGLIGFFISLVLIKYGRSESIFRAPISMILKFLCPSDGCGTNVIGYAITFVIITILFYTLGGAIIGIIINKITKK